MTTIDIEKLAREAGFQVLTLELNGCEPMKLIQAVSSTTFRPELVRFAALLLEKAAEVCDSTPPQPFRPSIEAAHAIRQLAKDLRND